MWKTAKKALRDKKTYDTWQEGFAQIFEAVLENKPFIMNVYHSVRREKIESFLYKLTYQLIADVVEKNAPEIICRKQINSLLQIFTNTVLSESC